jgi:hypothetical protein
VRGLSAVSRQPPGNVIAGKPDIVKNDDKHEETARRERRAYEKPSINWEEQLDVRRTLAVACAKIRGKGGLCNAAPTS